MRSLVSIIKRLSPPILGLSLLAGCSTSQTPLESELATDPAAESTGVETHALDPEQLLAGIDNPVEERPNPWELVDATLGKSPAESNALLLEAAEIFLDQQHYSTAYSMLEEIDTSWLDPEQTTYFALVRARYELLTGQTDIARSLLNPFRQESNLSRDNQIRLLQLEIAIAAQGLDFRSAVLTRIRLDPLLEIRAQLSNQNRILSTLTREPQVFTADEPALQQPVLAGWIDLADLNRQHHLSEEVITLWQQRHPGHPALVVALVASSTHRAITSEQIALLLPLTSKLGHAAQAFKAGFEAAARDSGQIDSSLVYDIGTETDLVGLYYQSAVNDGADFIIGPLGRAGALSLLDHLERIPQQGVSTLLLGELAAEQDDIANVWGLSLSPEQDAAAIAEYAVSRGMRSALLLEKNNAWGARLASAFRSEFESRGGRVVDSQRFQPQQEDHSAEIKNLLQINNSDLRHQRLQDQLGTQLEFSVRRRNDVDFIFLAGTARDARRILPLVKFYRAHDLPVLATSSVYNGQFNKLTDEDLKDLQFTDLPWLLHKEIAAQEREKARIRAAEEAAEAAARAQAQGAPAPVPEAPDTTLEAEESAEPEFTGLPYSSATLNRLYALGYTAYATIPQLNYLQSDEWYRFETQTMSINMDEYRNLKHSVAWGRYVADGIRLVP